MSNLALEGYRQNGDDCDNWGDRCVAVADNNNYDMAAMTTYMKLFFLDALGYTTKNFYENGSTIAGGSGIHSPVKLSDTAVQSALNSNLYGFVDFAGHGNGYGVYRVYWPGDLNGNGVMNLHSNPALNEVGGGNLFTTGNLANLTADNTLGGVYAIMACSVGDPDTSGNFASTILSGGHGVAAIGALSVVGVGSFTGASVTNSLAQQDNYFITQRILLQNQRLGDAVWGTLSERLQKNSNGSGQISLTLFGDPSMSYLGDPSAGTRQAPWSMIRREANGQAYFTLPGPALPVKLWEYDAAAPTPNLPRPSPVVSANGEVIVAAGNALHVLRQGQLFQSLGLDAQAYGTPALAADGSLYAVDVNGKLYAFQYPLIQIGPSGQLRTRRWAHGLGGQPLTSPTISPDGSILVGVDQAFPFSAIAVMRPDGIKQTSLILSGKVVQAVTASADRVVYAAGEGPLPGLGVIYRMEPYCVAAYNSCSLKVQVLDSPFSTAPLLAYGYLYAGLEDGRVLQMNPRTLEVIHAYATGGRVTAGPVTGPGGQVLVGNENSRYYSLTQSLGLRWSRLLGDPAYGVPAFTVDHLYVTAGDLLVALNPSSGQKDWQKYFPGAGNGSAAVGYGREVYFQTSSGRVIAIGENWVEPPNLVIYTPIKIGVRAANRIEWNIDARQAASQSALPSAPPDEAGQAPSSEAGAASPNDLGAAQSSQAGAASQNDLSEASPSEAGAASPSDLGAAPGQTTADPLGVLLQRSLDGNEWVDLTLLPPGTTVYTDTAITSDADYQYRLQVIDPSGKNSDFTYSNTERSLPSLPGAALITQVSALSSSSLRVAWDAPASGPVEQYRIERSLDAGGPFDVYTTLAGDASAYVDTQLDPGTGYFYRVTALNATGNGPVSNVLGATTFQQSLPAPQNFSAALQSDDTIQLSWSGRPGGASSVLEVIPFGSSDWLPVATLDADSYTYLPNEPGEYDFRVKFVQGTDESPYAKTAASITIQRSYALYLPVMVR